MCYTAYGASRSIATVIPLLQGRYQQHGPGPERRTAMYEKTIVYDPETRDFAMYLDGELVGFARTYQEAEVTLDQLVFELINGQYFREAA
jgi:hypothetical protein